MGDNQGGPLHLLDDARHRESLTAAGHAQQGLVRETAIDALGELVDGLWLVARRLEVRDDFEFRH